MKYFAPALMAMALTYSPVQAADTYTIDPEHTFANFAISHLGMSTLHGRIDSKGGSFSFDPEAKTGSVTVELDPASVDTGHQKRDDHLRSPDFLNTVEFPDMSFESTNVTLDDEGGTVEGNLTLMGQSKPVTLTITRWNCGEHPFTQKAMCGFDATTTINRTEWGVNYGTPAIGEEMQLWIGVQGFKEE